MKRNKLTMLAAVLLACIMFFTGCSNNTISDEQINRMENKIVININGSDKFRDEYIKGAADCAKNTKYNIIDSDLFKNDDISGESSGISSEESSDYYTEYKNISGYIIDSSYFSSGADFINQYNKNDKVIFTGIDRSTLESTASSEAQYTCINYDSEKIGTDLAGYIVKLASKKINCNVLSVYPSENQDFYKKEYEFLQVGLLSQSILKCSINSAYLPVREDTYDLIKETISKTEKLDVIYAYDADMAVIMTQVLKDLDMHDVAVISGYFTDDISEKIVSGEIISAVSRMPFTLGSIACDNMIKMKSGEQVADVKLESTIVNKDNISSVKSAN